MSCAPKSFAALMIPAALLRIPSAMACTVETTCSARGVNCSAKVRPI
jgi:hypothetical protein